MVQTWKELDEVFPQTENNLTIFMTSEIISLQSKENFLHYEQ